MININVEKSWVDTNTKIGFVLGFLIPVDNYIRGGDPVDFALSTPGQGYNKLIHFSASGHAPNESTPTNQYSYFIQTSPASQVSAPFGRAKFFGGYDELIDLIDRQAIQVPYPDTVKVAIWRFLAIFEKP